MLARAQARRRPRSVPDAQQISRAPAPASGPIAERKPISAALGRPSQPAGLACRRQSRPQSQRRPGCEPTPALAPGRVARVGQPAARHHHHSRGPTEPPSRRPPAYAPKPQASSAPVWASLTRETNLKMVASAHWWAQRTTPPPPPPPLPTGSEPHNRFDLGAPLLWQHHQRIRSIGPRSARQRRPYWPTLRSRIIGPPGVIYRAHQPARELNLEPWATLSKF